MNIQSFLDPVAYGNAVYSVTGQLTDSAVAAGYAEWIKAITGSYPIIQQTDAKHVKIIFTDAQIPVIRSWLDTQLKGALTPSKAGPVTYDLGPALGPWVLKYAVPSVIGIFLAGAATMFILNKMRVL